MRKSISEVEMDAFVDSLIEMRRSLEPYKDSMIRDGWSVEAAEDVTAHLVKEMHRRVVNS